MEHVHMPLQSGDDKILRDMKRVYTIESYRELLQELRATIPGVSITTDMIVGFPGETDEEFENTLQTMAEMRFDAAYMFAYSIRPDTVAGDREDQISAPVKKERLRRIMDLQDRITCEINETYIGRTVEVLVEGPSPKNPERLQGYSREFKLVNFKGSASRAGRLAKVVIHESHGWGLTGELAAA
jgi:tRNA-2-methylthio-N6-dimethylallyladenosine synthase